MTDNKVTFSNWQKGQTKHPINGNGLLRNVEVFENPGIVKLQPRSVLDSTITPTALPLAEEIDKYGNVYIATGETGQGTIYKNGVSIQSSLSNVWDIKVYNDYLWVRHGTVVSAYGPLNNSPQWFGNVITNLESSYRGVMLVGQDSKVYITNGNNIFAFTATGGTPAVAPVATPSAGSGSNALDLPDNDIATCLAELGSNLMIGTGQGNSYVEIKNNRSAKIYPWDRVSTSFRLPVVLNEKGVHQMLSFANKLYVVAGTIGNIYESDSVNYRKIATLPYTVSNYTGFIEYFPNAIALSDRGTLLVGVSVGSDGVSKAGVYEINLNDPNYPVALSRTISTGNMTSTSGRISIGYISSKTSGNVLGNIGWRDVNTFGVDNTSNVFLYPNYAGVIETELKIVGSHDHKRSFQYIQFLLSDPLVSGQSIRISYRTDSKSSYTLISPTNEWSYSTIGGLLSFTDKVGIKDAILLQLKIELNQSTSTVYGNNISLISVSLW